MVAMATFLDKISLQHTSIESHQRRLSEAQCAPFPALDSNNSGAAQRSKAAVHCQDDILSIYYSYNVLCDHRMFIITICCQREVLCWNLINLLLRMMLVSNMWWVMCSEWHGARMAAKYLQCMQCHLMPTDCQKSAKTNRNQCCKKTSESTNQYLQTKSRQKNVPDTKCLYWDMSVEIIQMALQSHTTWARSQIDLRDFLGFCCTMLRRVSQRCLSSWSTGAMSGGKSVDHFFTGDDGLGGASSSCPTVSFKAIAWQDTSGCVDFSESPTSRLSPGLCGNSPSSANTIHKQILADFSNHNQNKIAKEYFPTTNKHIQRKDNQPWNNKPGNNQSLRNTTKRKDNKCP